MILRSPIFRKLLSSAFFLIVVTLLLATRWRVLGAALVAAALAFGMAYLFSRSYARRVERLKGFADDLANFAATGPTAAPTATTLASEATSDELGVLARALNGMARRLGEVVGRLGQESAERQAILSSMVEGVLAVDAELRVTFFNEAFARAVGAGLASADLLDRTPLVDLVRNPELSEMLRRVLESGESLQRRFQFPGRNGAESAFEVQVTPLASASGSSGSSSRGALAILHDITDLERLERIRKDFVANVSHELRTPLTAIRGYAETLLEGGLEDQENNRRFLEIISAHAIRLNNIASDLLTLSELESSRPSRPGAEPERVSTRAVIEASLRTVEPEARLRGVTLVSEKLEDAEVVGNRIHLEQVVVNLLSNAVKFNRPGGEVRVGCGRANGQVRIVVADTGIGIHSEHLPRIFERFYRADKARSREVGGTGLGLSIVKHIVERMNGTVAAESQLGKGSTFTVLLPAAE
ncbi:MAG TPA: ATP-binding protein [Terriglobia bacterium]|nr:ATP-binding protein [Terriglobia bacterium]